MITSPVTQDRLMVPRWRSFQLTTLSRELSVPAVPLPGRSFSSEFLKKLAAWRIDPSLVSAAELVEAAIVEGQDHEAVAAARLLLRKETTAAPLIKKQAAILMRRTGHDSEIPLDIAVEQHGTAKFWRRRTRTNPNDAMAWVELALAQTISGHLEHAKRSIHIALHLAPNNRHVLRSAARFYLRIEDREQAHQIILRSEAAQTDPWLIASEIALSRLADASPRLYKRGVSIVENDQLLPRQITELSGSIATNELIEGNRKKARKFFRESMADPNGNALAQAEWAQPRFGDKIVPEFRLLAVEEAFEARAIHAYREGHFGQSILACEGWAHDEPHSVRPFEFGAAAACIVEAYDKAEELSRLGLVIRPDSPVLINNYAFALAAQGNVDQAELALKRLPKDVEPYVRHIETANLGLIALRRQNMAEALRKYDEAVTGFKKEGKNNLALSARVYLAREAARAGFVTESATMVEGLAKDVEKSNSPSERRVFRGAQLFIEAARAVKSLHPGQALTIPSSKI